MDLITLNPWWEHKGAIENDKHLRMLGKFKYVQIPYILNEDFKKGNLYTIRGPRQIGKTTLIKMLIRKKLKNTPGENILYWSCDSLVTKDDLIQLLNEYGEFCQVRDSKPEYIFLDEITGIPDWQKALKFVIDADILPDACYILTGSNAMDLKRGTERLPGRRGEHGKDLFLLPLTFREYVELLEPEWYDNHFKDDPMKLRYHGRKLKILFEKYLITGGIPLVINEYEKNGEIPNYVYDLYYSWITGDILKEGKNEQNLKELMKSILISYSTPVSWESLAKRSSIKSHVTISSYVEVLSNIFVVVDCYFYDIHEDRVNYNKNKKIYFLDPFILQIFEDRLNITVDKEKIIEGIVGSHLKHKDVLGEIYFTRIKKETDFVMDPGTGLEVKYRNRLDNEDYRNKSYFKEFKVLSKSKFDENTVPVYNFLFAERI